MIINILTVNVGHFCVALAQIGVGVDKRKTVLIEVFGHIFIRILLGDRLSNDS